MIRFSGPGIIQESAPMFAEKVLAAAYREPIRRLARQRP
jgi:hypothetical protein